MCVENINFDEFTLLIAEMEITNQFIIYDWFGDMPIYFDSQREGGVELALAELKERVVGPSHPQFRGSVSVPSHSPHT